MDKETLEASWGLVYGVAEDVRDYLFGESPYVDNEIDLLENIDDAIQEVESWKNSIREKKKIINSPPLEKVGIDQPSEPPLIKGHEEDI